MTAIYIYTFYPYGRTITGTGSLANFSDNSGPGYLLSLPTSLWKGMAPALIMIRWIAELMKRVPRRAPKIASKAIVAPAIRPRCRDIHHGEHLLNFHRC